MIKQAILRMAVESHANQLIGFCMMATLAFTELRKLSLSLSYLNINSPSKRVRIIKSEKEISELLEVSGEIYKSALLEHYFSRPRQNLDIKNICLAVFAFYNFMLQKNKIISQIR